jgi:FkbM family methyltransferase
VSLRDRLRSRRERRLRRRTAGHRVLEALAELRPEVCFVEVGAGDGVTADHLRPFAARAGWRGIMVEPVPYVFERLRRNYADIQGVSLENVAISDRDGSVTFHYLAEPARGERVPDRYHLLGSLSRDLLLRNPGVPDAERRVVTTELPSVTFASLCEEHGVESLDVLVIDAEGHDCEILARVDIDGLRPRVLAYEDVHVPEAEAGEARARLERLGYECLQEGFDTWCVDTRPDDSVTASWRRVVEEGPAVPREDLDRWFAARA